MSNPCPLDILDRNCGTCVPVHPCNITKEFLMTIYPGYTTGGYACTVCGVFVPLGTFHACNHPVEYAPGYVPVVMKGWQCPCCGSVYAPWVSRCNNCIPKTTTGGTIG